MARISFETTREEDLLINQIVERAENYGRSISIDRFTLTMDLVVTHSNGCPLDFAKLLAFDSFDFVHDISGIISNINRTTGKLENCFLPRCAK